MVAVFLSGYLVSSHVHKDKHLATQSPVMNEDTAADPVVSDDLDELKLALQKLRARLGHAEKENKKLLVVNENLSQRLDQLEHSRNIPISYPALTRQLDSIPDFILNKQLSYLFGDEFVDGIDNPKEFSKHLLDAALDSGSDVNNDTPSVRVSFSESVFPTTKPIGFDSQVGIYDVIFAHFDADQGLSKVLVKWMNVSNGEVLMFSQASIRGGQPNQFVSLKPAQGWRNGTYRVSVYSADNSVHLLGSNSYRITSVINDGTQTADGSNYEVIQELLATGQARPKSAD